jgi:hypothetical protein
MRIDVNGLEAATGVTQGAVNNQKADMRIVLIRFDADTVYQFIFASRRGRRTSTSGPSARPPIAAAI